MWKTLDKPLGATVLIYLALVPAGQFLATLVFATGAMFRTLPFVAFAVLAIG